jgi:excinuclease ABC subunit A
MTQREKHLQALNSFVTRVKKDPNVVAILIYGSLAYGTVWERSDIDVELIVRDGTEFIARWVYVIEEEGVEINISAIAELAKFKNELQRLRRGYDHGKYGEAQRRFLRSVSNYAKSRIGQVKKPNVDYVRGLSPVIAIEQKKGNNNPRSTVGTVTDINDYLRLLFATIGTGKCPVCGHVLDPVSAALMAECITSLPQGTVVELYTTAKKTNGEDYEFIFEKIRKRDINDCSLIMSLPDCHGSRLKASRLSVTVGGADINTLSMMQFPEVIKFLENLEIPLKHKDVADSIIREIISRIQLLVDIGLHYLCLGRRSDSISGGEMQRIKMSTQISSELCGILYVMDEPSIGLHPRDCDKIIEIMRKLRDLGNTVIVVEHDLETLRSADYLIEIGPGAGSHGGIIISTGIPAQFIADENSLSGAYMSGKRTIPLPDVRRKPSDRFITLQGAKENNLKNITLDIPLELFVCITGVSGSGKSTLIFETLSKHLDMLMRSAHVVSGKLDYISGYDSISNVITIDQSPIGRNCKSNPATYIGIFDRIRALFASTPDAISKGFEAVDFSLTHANGARCEHCGGDGILVTNLQFMADIESICPVCKGRRFSQNGLNILYNGKSIADVLEMTAEEALKFFSDEKLIRHKLNIMNELGLGYLTLGQNAPTLSGGEAQRVKLSYELGKIKHGNHNLYILDEPTTGLHCADVEKLLLSIQKLVEQGHTVIVVEHNLDVIKSADYIIDMGPEGGKNGGYVVATGTPEEVAKVEGSFTGQYLKKILR